MFLFNENAAFRLSLEQHFFGLGSGTSQRRANIFLFQGPVPETIEDIPFDIRNPVQVARNSVGSFIPEFERGENRSELAYTSLTEASTIPKEFKHHYYDSDREMWRLYPSVVCNEAAYDDLEAGNLNESSISDAYRYIASMSLIAESDVDKYVTGEANTQFYTSMSRYTYNDPHIWEFDQIVTLDHMFLKQTHSGGSYDNTYFDIQYWDTLLNEGQGGWSDSTRVSYSGGNNANEVVLPSITGQKFRIAGGDTGSKGWLQKNCTFFSSVEPSVSEINCTWALLGSGFNGSNNLYTAYDFNSEAVDVDWGHHKNYLPWAVLDVGSPENEASLMLQTSLGINGKESITPLSLRLIV